MFTWRQKGFGNDSAGEDDDQCAAEEQTGSYWAKAERMRARERECLCLDNKLLRLINGLAGREGGEAVGLAVGLGVPML